MADADLPDTQFSEDDFGPSDDDRRVHRAYRIEQLATTVAVVAIGVWIGGMVSLGACAAPMVFQRTPAPFSGDAMGAAFARFDRIALAAAVIALGGEVVRTWVRRNNPNLVGRARRLGTVLMAAGAAYVGLVLTPEINALHQAGVRRGVGAQGMVLETTHQRAELVGKAEVILGVLVIGLHIFTLGAARPNDDDEADAPLPPGPS